MLALVNITTGFRNVKKSNSVFVAFVLCSHGSHIKSDVLGDAGLLMVSVIYVRAVDWKRT